jgi:leucyl aminopeptidase
MQGLPMTPFRPLALAGLSLALAVPALAPVHAAAAPKAPVSASSAEPAAWTTATRRRPVSFAETAPAASGVLVIAAGSVAEASERASALLAPEAGAGVRRAVEAAGFDFSSGEMLVLRAFGGLEQVVLLGVGKSPQGAGEALGRSLAKVRAPVTVSAGALGAEGLAALATGFGIGEYRSDLLSSDRPTTSPAAVVFTGAGAAGAETIYRGRGQALVEAVHSHSRKLRNPA